MSYGRKPYYIYGTTLEDDGKEYFCFIGGAFEDADQAILVSYDAMAQLIASMWFRDNNPLPYNLPVGEIGKLLERGFELRPELRQQWYDAMDNIEKGWQPSEDRPAGDPSPA